MGFALFNVYLPVIGSGWMVVLAFLLGPTLYAIGCYGNKSKGISNNRVFQSGFTSGGKLAWVLGILVLAFYIFLYWFPSHLGYGEGGSNTGLLALFDPISIAIKGKPASQWFVYGLLYTVLILSLGVKFYLKYRHDSYQRIRTMVVALVQLIFAFFIPEILSALSLNDAVGPDGTHLGYFDADLKNIWPLNHDFFYGYQLDAMTASHYQPVGMIFLVTGLLMFLVATPVTTYLFGKRWYCSWVCGCGGLAETAGDPFRQLSSKKLSVWRLERWLIHGVTVGVVVMTVATLYGYLFGRQDFLGLNIYHNFQKPYGFLIGAVFSGVIGVGFYPWLGSRVWCRLGCPMAAYLGLIQRFKSRFRITTNGGQCISCGNCSTYCEQGIDVRWYAQRGQNIVRSSCVGCGICSSVCPRGVLKLENGPERGRIQS